MRKVLNFEVFYLTAHTKKKKKRNSHKIRNEREAKRIQYTSNYNIKSTKSPLSHGGPQIIVFISEH